MEEILLEANAGEKKYKCPYCEVRVPRKKLCFHIQEEHPDMIPQNMTPLQVAFNAVNKKKEPYGHCIVCHTGITMWNEDKGRYERICSDKCKKQYVQMCEERLQQRRGVTKQEMLSDPEFQNKMLAGRSISGTYKFTDGGKLGYVGSYEKNFLEFMDKVMHVKSSDIEAPGPTIQYTYQGKEHFWITDCRYIPYDLVFDIKDGGSNPNTREMKEYREKQVAKEDAITKQGKYNYCRLTDNNFGQLLSIMLELKESLINFEHKTIDDNRFMPIVRINESADKSTFVDNFKLKTGKKIKYYTARENDIDKYLSKYSHDNIEFRYPNVKYWIIAVDKSKDKIVGTCAINYQNIVKALLVDPDYRGYGIGETLFRDIINKFGGNKLGVYADNQVALRLYEKYGFKKVAEDKDKNGELYYIYERKTITESAVNEHWTGMSTVIGRSADSVYVVNRVKDGVFTGAICLGDDTSITSVIQKFSEDPLWEDHKRLTGSIQEAELKVYRYIGNTPVDEAVADVITTAQINRKLFTRVYVEVCNQYDATREITESTMEATLKRKTNDSLTLLSESFNYGTEDHYFPEFTNVRVRRDKNGFYVQNALTEMRSKSREDISKTPRLVVESVNNGYLV